MHAHSTPPAITPADLSLPPTTVIDLTWLVTDAQRLNEGSPSESQ